MSLSFYVYAACLCVMNKNSREVDTINKDIETNDNLIDDDDYEYEKAVAQRNRELIWEREQLEEQLKAEEEQAKKEREKRLKDEKIELLRLKNGVVDQEDTSMKEVREEQTQLHGKAKIANIWYHNKVWIIFGTLILVAAAFMIYDAVSKEKADITVMMVANNGLADRQEDIEKFFEKYTPDFDGNGYVHVNVIMVPQSENDLQNQGVNNTKLVANLQLADAIMVITDEETDDEIKGIMKDMTEDFPDNKYVDELGLKLDTDKAARELNYENMPKDVHISMRTPAKTTGDSLEKMQENFDKSYKVFKAIAEDME